ANLERVTLFAIPGPADRPQNVPPPLIVITLNKPVDQAKLISFLMPNAQPETIGDTGAFVDGNISMALFVVDRHTFVISAPESVRAFLSRPKTANGPMAAVTETAASKQLTIAVNASALPPEAMQQIPPPFQPIAQATLATLTVDVSGPEIVVDARLRYADDGAAKAAEKAAHDGIALARGKLQEAKKDLGKALLEPKTPAPAPLRELPEALASFAGLAVMGTYDDLLTKVPLMRDGATLSLQVKAPAH